MLLEIPFINGYNEFVEYFSKEIYIDLDENFNFNTYEIELLEDSVTEDSITYLDVLNSNIDFNLKLIVRDKIYYIVIESAQILQNLKLNIQYTYKNNNPKNLYSIDYSTGIVFFSEKTSKEYSIEYEYDNLICIGKASKQLLETDFNFVSKIINIKNYKENSLISFLYKKENTVHRNITHVIHDLKLNYIIKDDISL